MNNQQLQQMGLTQDQYNFYKSQGYTDQQISQAWQEAMKEAQQEQSKLQQSYANVQSIKSKDPRATSSNTYVTGSYNENLIQWQLELDSILERIEHMLRGDRPTFENGSIVWKTPTETKDKILNDFGVGEVMRILSIYLNRNTILSNYREEIIDNKMYDLGNELADLFYLKYEAMGLDDLEKRKLYPIICRELVDVVHSSYLRALHGGERESLREARQVTQTAGVGDGVTINNQYPQKSRGLLNPMRWVKGKYA